MLKGYAVVRAERTSQGYMFDMETDTEELFTNKYKAEAEARRLIARKKAINGIRKAEGSKERITDTYIVVFFQWKTPADIPKSLVAVEKGGDEI